MCDLYIYINFLLLGVGSTSQHSISKHCRQEGNNKEPFECYKHVQMHPVAYVESKYSAKSNMKTKSPQGKFHVAKIYANFQPLKFEFIPTISLK